MTAITTGLAAALAMTACGGADNDTAKNATPTALASQPATAFVATTGGRLATGRSATVTL
ncbi:hypothetical protein [Streptomyces minutiscleroticus]|uniref:hypothetical protein n=1 Tax=Streptomyces minutiscleroticus TaxID=68238 RepID=UPI00331DF2B6